MNRTLNISGDEIIAMLHQKGHSITSLARKHNFEERDLMATIKAEKCYPNIANIVAKIFNVTPHLLWPSLYPLPTPGSSTSCLVVRVTQL